MDHQLTTTHATPETGAVMLFDVPRMESLMRFAELMATSVVTIPTHLHGKPADCMAVAMQALRWGMDPFVVAQKTHIVSGRMGYEAQLVNAVVQSTRAIKGSFSYEYKGEGNNLECRVGAVLRGENEITWGEWLRCGDVTTKNSPLWKVNPKQQLGYLQIKNWARLYCPGAILGAYTVDELEDSPIRPQQVEAPRGPQRRSTQVPTPAPAAEVIESTDVSDAVEVSPPVEQRAAAPVPPAASSPAGDRTSAPIGAGQLAYLRNKLRSAEISEDSLFERFGVQGLDQLGVEQFDELKAELLSLV